MDILISFGVLLIALFGLVKSSDFLISSSSILGSRVGISKIVIGLTLVAIGTSLPELVSVVFGLLESQSGGDFFTGTIIGSNIANSMLVLAALLYFTRQKLSTIIPRENWFLIVATLFFVSMILLVEVSIFSGIVFLSLFATYIYMTLFTAKGKDLEDESDEFESDSLNKRSSSLLVGIFILSLIGLNLSARGVVYGIDTIAVFFSMPQFILTFTTLALATSLPELIVTIRSAKHGETDIALGNIVGSNISNILLIGGVGSILVNFLDISIITSLLSLILLSIATIMVILISNKLPNKHYKEFGVVLFFMYLIFVTSILIF